MNEFIKKVEPYIRELERLIGLSFKVFTLTAIVVISLGIYIANLLFGNHSLSVLTDLQKEKRVLEIDIDRLKKENALLHKKYLEWIDSQE